MTVQSTHPSLLERAARYALTRLGQQLANLRQSFVLPDQRKQWLWVVLRAAVLLALYVPLSSHFFETTRLPEAVYHQNSVLLVALERKEILALVILGCAVPLLRYKRTSWRVLDTDFSVRILVLASVGTLAWALSTYDYNWYYDHWHAYDRLLLVALALLTFVHPAFVAPFVTLTAVMTYQFDHPMGQFSWTDKRLLFCLLLLFSTMLVTRTVVRIGNRTYLLLALCLHAESYLQPAFTKLALNWLHTNELYHLFISAHVNGWLPNISEQAVASTARVIQVLNPVLLLGTLLVELSPALILLNARLARFVFVGCALLHLGIFFSSGIFFWKWIIVNAALFAVVTRLPRTATARVFGLTSRYFWVSLLIFAFFGGAFRSAELGWIDTRLNNMYRMEAVSSSGTRGELGPDYFAPYDMRFAQNRFSYLVKTPHIEMTFGMLGDLDLVTALAHVDEPAQALQFDAKHGARQYSRKRVAHFDRFIKVFVGNRQAAGGAARTLGLLAAPHHIYVWATAAAKHRDSDIKRVQVHWLTTWQQGYRSVVLRDKIVHRVTIP